MIKSLNFTNFFNIISGPYIVVVDFYSETCEPCQRFMKILPRLDDKISNKAIIGTVSTDTEKELTKMYRVDKVPTTVFFKGGKEWYRVEGKIMTIKEIEEKVNELFT